MLAGINKKERKYSPGGKESRLSSGFLFDINSKSLLG